MWRSAPFIVALAAIVGLVGCGEDVILGTQEVLTETPIEVVAAPTETPTPEVPLAARVNGQPIALEEFERQFGQFEKTIAQLKQTSGGATQEMDMEQARRQVLEWMVDQELIDQAAAREGLTVSEEELDGRVESIVTEAGGQAAFEKWLGNNGLNLAGFREQLRSELLGQKMRDRVLEGLSVQAEQVHARHILVGSREEAEAILARLESGVDFAGLARERSQDVASGENGGDLGFFPRGIMDPSFEEAAFALAPGEVGGPVQTAFGFHIIQVLERDPSRQISEPMLQALRDRAFVRWLQGQRDAAAIERFIG